MCVSVWSRRHLIYCHPARAARLPQPAAPSAADPGPCRGAQIHALWRPAPRWVRACPGGHCWGWSSQPGHAARPGPASLPRNTAGRKQMDAYGIESWTSCMPAHEVRMRSTTSRCRVHSTQSWHRWPPYTGDGMCAPFVTHNSHLVLAPSACHRPKPKGWTSRKPSPGTPAD